MGKRVCVLGGGASGLAGIKACLEEGFEVVCYERQDDIGGLWRYKPSETDESSVMKSTVINTSKEMMAYSDFPPPASTPNFMHNREVIFNAHSTSSSSNTVDCMQVMDYFRSYAEKFNLMGSIRFCHGVHSIRRAPDFLSSGKWIVNVSDENGKRSQETFDAVLLGSGHHAEPYSPTFPGLAEFKGRVIHAHSYKDHRGFEDQRIVVVGAGNSGFDIAVELSRICSQVYSATRRGSWIFNRVGEKGIPTDLIGSRRVNQAIMGLSPNLAQGMFENMLNNRFDHAAYGLKPKHRPNIREVRNGSVVFEDGTVAENIDTIIVATGYSFGFPYLEEGLIPVHENQVNLYKYMYPPQLEKQTLAVLGCIQPLGAVMPIAELQARVFARVLAGTARVPSRKGMEADVAAKRSAMKTRYVASRRHTIQVDYISYMDELGEIIGVTPHVKDFIFSDPILAYKLFFGPTLPYQWRLTGPGAWPGARKALLTVMDRVYAPISTRKVETAQKSSSFMVWALVTAVLLFIYYIFF